MRRAWVVIALAVVACKKDPEPPAKAPPAPLAKAPPPEILPEGADMTFPAESPVISTHSGGGEGGGDRGGLAVWADGSVRYTIQKCRKQPRRGKLPPERVTALLAALDQVGMFAPEEPNKLGNDVGHCCDCVSTSLSARKGNVERTLVDYGCGSDPGVKFRQAMTLVHDAIGVGPCAYPPPPDLK